MTITTSTHRQKDHSIPIPDSSNCNSLYGVFETGLVVFIWLQPILCYLELMPSTLLVTSVNSVNSNHIDSWCLYVGYDTVKHAKLLAIE